MKCTLIHFLLLIALAFSVQAKDGEWVYTTRPGDTLWDISKSYLKNPGYWSKLQKHNGIESPRLLPPGTRLFIPVHWLKQQPKPAVVEMVSGDAYVNLGNSKTSLSLKAGMKIPIQSKIVTNSAATVVLKFADGSRLIVKQNAIVLLDVLTAHESSGMVDTRMRLQRGRVETQVIPFKNDSSRFEITTPAAVASVRGTQFRVSVDSDSETMYSEVVVGEIAVASQGITQIVPTGFGTKTELGKSPQSPQKLLGAADLSGSQTVFMTPEISFSWPSIAEAKSYQVAIASGSQFYNILYDKKVSTSNVFWSTQKTGVFSLRIRGINDIGNEGMDAIHVFSILEDFSPPKLASPRYNEQVTNQEISFHWLGDSRAERFYLQVSANSSFDEAVIEVTGNQQYYTAHKKLSPGKYYWRVANKYPEGTVGKYSDVFSFDMTYLP